MKCIRRNKIDVKKLLRSEQYRYEVAMQFVPQGKNYVKRLAEIVGASEFDVYAKIKKYNLPYEKYSRYTKAQIEKALIEAEKELGKKWGVLGLAAKKLGGSKQSMTKWIEKYQLQHLCFYADKK
jgi:hypothetical protein